MCDSEGSNRVGPHVGHYFDQVHFDLHYRRLARQAEVTAIAVELEALGVSVDPVTGKVAVTRPTKQYEP